MFWLVSGKGQKRPFCPNDKWAGLAGHFSLPLSFTLILSFPPSTPLPPTFSLPFPTQSHNLFPPICGQEMDSTRWQIYCHRHEVKRLKLLVTPRDPLLGRWYWSTIYICWGPSKGQHLYISATGDSVRISQKIALGSLSSWKDRIFSFFLNISGFLSWCFFTFRQMCIWTTCVRFPPWPKGGKAGSRFRPGWHVGELVWGL